MNFQKLIAIVLLVGGTVALAYGGFSYTKDSTAIKLGSLELSVEEKQTISVPIWVGVGAVAIGGLLLLLGGRKP